MKLLLFVAVFLLAGDECLSGKPKFSKPKLPGVIPIPVVIPIGVPGPRPSYSSSSSSSSSRRAPLFLYDCDPLKSEPCPGDTLDAPPEVNFTLYRKGESNITSWKDNSLDFNKTMDDIDSSTYMKIIIHDYRSNGREKLLIKEYMDAWKMSNHSIVYANWSEPMARWCRLGARVERASAALSRLLAMLARSGGDVANMHMVGVGVGAHAAAAAADAYNRESGGKKVGRLTALDPDSVCFRAWLDSFRLRSSSAVFVDVLQTSANHTLVQRGDVDFLIHGGRAQPDCSDGNAVARARCSHRTALRLFVASVHNETFPAHLCSSWRAFRSGACGNTTAAPIGEYVDSTSPHGFYFYGTGPSASSAERMTAALVALIFPIVIVSILK